MVYSSWGQSFKHQDLAPGMDAVGSAAGSAADVASSVLRESVTVISTSAGELAKQATQLANSKDPLAWLAGDDDEEADGFEVPPPEPFVGVPLSALQPWGASFAGISAGIADNPFVSDSEHRGSDNHSDDMVGASGSAQRPPPFAVDPEVNGKVVLWQGELCSLEVDALIAPSAAGFTTGASTVFSTISRHGGKDLRAELKHIDSCRSGEARLAKAYNLPCRWLLLTVGPKYKDKYLVAAENTLNSCYRESLQLLVEAELRTVGVPCCWYNKGYPPEEQAHVGLRTVRRCIEKLRSAIDLVVIVAANAQEAEMYGNLMPLYFPRNASEVKAGARVLPDSCWSQWGEVTVEERKIPISSSLISTDREDDDDIHSTLSKDPLFSPGDDDLSFLSAREDADDIATRRLEGTMIEAEDIDSLRAACLRYLRRAREMRSEPLSSCFVYGAGQDQFARHIVVLLGARLPSLGIRDERTLPLFVKELEALRGGRFVLLYVNSSVSAMDTTCLEVLQEMLAMIGAKYRASLEQLIVLHPGLWFRAAFAFGRAVNDHAANVWNESIYAESVVDLSRYLPTERLNLPQYVFNYDSGR